jgi:hypothetical protein
MEPVERVVFATRFRLERIAARQGGGSENDRPHDGRAGPDGQDLLRLDTARSQVM